MSMQQLLTEELEAICADGLYKDERVITTPQGPGIRVMGGDEVLNFCANNYLGLANHPEVIAAAKQLLVHLGRGDNRSALAQSELGRDHQRNTVDVEFVGHRAE